MADLKLAAAIVVHHGRVLIVRRSDTETFWPGVWGVPCGKLEGNESPSEAVLRELREETGLSGKKVDFVGRSVFSSNWRGRAVENIQNNYLVEPEVNPADTDSEDMPVIRTPKKDQESGWVDTDKLDSVQGLDEHNLRTIRQGLAAQASPSGPEFR